MRLRNTILTGAASYIQMGSLMITQLVAIPMALRFLDNERFGLWSFTSQSLGYLLLLDFGVSASIGRLMADPIHSGDDRARNGWFNLILAILIFQGLLILGVGLATVNPILSWFHIPPALVPEARKLWLIALGLNAINVPFRLFQGILGAQNRFYWYFFSTSFAAFLGLIVFYFSLKAGAGSLAYAFSMAAQIVSCIMVTAIGVIRGPNKFRVSLRGIPWAHTRELFGFSSAVFVINIAVQVALMSPSLVITKILGLSAVASYSVSTRVPSLLMQLIWRPFDAFNSRWQIFWVNGEKAPLFAEFMRIFKFTMALGFFGMICSLAMNRWFVFIFGKSQLYIGKEFDFLFGLFVIAQVWNHCLSIFFGLSKKMTMFAAVIALDTVVSIIVSIYVTKMFGLNGYIGASALYGMTSLGFWYISIKAPQLIDSSAMEMFRKNRVILAVFMALLTGNLFLFKFATSASLLLAIEIGIPIIAAILFAVLFRDDLQNLIGWLKKANARRKQSGVETVQSQSL